MIALHHDGFSFADANTGSTAGAGALVDGRIEAVDGDGAGFAGLFAFLTSDAAVRTIFLSVNSFVH